MVAGSTAPRLRVGSAPLIAGEHPRAVRSCFVNRFIRRLSRPAPAIVYGLPSASASDRVGSSGYR